MRTTIITRRGFMVTGVLAVVAGCREVRQPANLRNASSEPALSPNAVLSRQASRIVQSPKRIWDLLPKDTRRYLQDQGISLEMLDDFKTDDSTWSLSADAKTATVSVRQRWTGDCYVRFSQQGLWVDAIPAPDLERAGQILTGAPDDVNTAEQLCMWLNESPEHLRRLGVGSCRKDAASKPLALSASAGIACNPRVWTSVAVTATPYDVSARVCHLQIQVLGPEYPVVVQVSPIGLITGVLRIDNQTPRQFFARQVKP